MNRPYYVLISKNEGIMGISKDIKSLFRYGDVVFDEYIVRECEMDGDAILPTGPVVYCQKIEESS